jgi:hypothetical protein
LEFQVAVTFLELLAYQEFVASQGSVMHSNEQRAVSAAFANMFQKLRCQYV